jgi:hypothetical protein
LAAVVADGTLALDEVELLIETGPFHKYPVTFDAPVTPRLRVVPAQIGPLLVAPVNEGAGLTVAEVV